MVDCFVPAEVLVLVLLAVVVVAAALKPLTAVVSGANPQIWAVHRPRLAGAHPGQLALPDPAGCSFKWGTSCPLSGPMTARGAVAEIPPALHPLRRPTSVQSVCLGTARSLISPAGRRSRKPCRGVATMRPTSRLCWLIRGMLPKPLNKRRNPPANRRQHSQRKDQHWGRRQGLEHRLRLKQKRKQRWHSMGPVLMIPPIRGLVSSTGKAPR